MPALVSDAMMARATAFNSSGMQVAIISGPALGGLIFALGASAVYATSLALLLLACGLLLGLGYQRHVVASEPATLRTVLAGVRFVWHNKLLLGAISLDLFAVLLGGATALLPVYARDILHVGPMGLGFLRSAPAAGAFSMAFFLTHWPLKTRVGAKMFAAVAVFGIATIVFGVSTWFPVSLLALFVLGASDMVSVNIRSSLIALSTPDSMRGRVSSVSMLFIGASNELGEFESGFTAALMGTVPAVVAGGIGTLLVVGLWMKLFPPLTRVNKFTDVALPV